MTEQEETIKKIMNLLGKGDGRKAARDFETSLIQMYAEKPSGDSQLEYFWHMRYLGKLKGELIYQSSKSTNTALQNIVKQVIKDIDELLRTKLESPRPQILREGTEKKYHFADGSASFPEDLDRVVNHVFNCIRSTKINQAISIAADAEGVLMQLNPKLAKYDAMFEEIDPTQDLEEREVKYEPAGIDGTRPRQSGYDRRDADPIRTG